MSLFEELKRRNVFRVGVAYAVGAWLLLQLTDVLSELLKLPEQIGPIVVAMVAIGFPVVLFLAWAFEMTPEGVKREKDIDRSDSITPQTGKKLDRAIIALMAVAIAYLLFDKFAEIESKGAPETAAVAAQAEPEPVAEETSKVSPRSIAVLPFDNRSEQQSDTYFVEGIHDDLLTNLARIGDLKVISRTSVERYADSDKSLPEIAAELGVATIMEGAVQRAGNEVRINVQLIDANTDEHLWAEIFDREMTTENLFAIQTEISEAIASSLKATLTPEEQERISQQPTENLAAYNAYLRGRQLVKSRDSEAVVQAKAEFQRSLELDPNFAQAWVGLAEAHIYSAVYGSVPFNEALRLYGECADRAIALNSELGEAWAIRGVWLSMNERLEESEQAFEQALALSPNDANVLKLYAEALSLDIRRAKKGMAMIDRAIELDPFFTVSRTVRARFYGDLRMLDRAASEFRTIIELDPSSSLALNTYAEFAMNELGDYLLALQNFTRAIELDPGNPQLYWSLAELNLNLNHPRALEEIKAQVDAIDPEVLAAGIIEWLGQQHAKNLDGAIETMKWTMGRGYLPPIQFALGQTYAQAGRWNEARDQVVQAMPWLEQTETWPEQIPRSWGQACHAGWILTRSGEPEQGLELSQQTLEFIESEVLPMMEDKHLGALDVCLAAIGENERALDALEARLDHRHFGDWWLDQDLPVYADLRLDPRFAAAWDRVEADADQQRKQLIAEGAL